MAALMPQGKQQYFTAGGIPLVGGKVYTYAAGTTTPLATYTTSAASTPNANPVILDSRGEASIFFSAANYKIVVKDSLDSTIWTQDNLPGDAAASVLASLAASTGSSLVGHIASGTGAVATTVQAQLRKTIFSSNFPTLQEAITSLSAWDTLHITGTNTISASLTITNKSHIRLTGPGSITLSGAASGAYIFQLVGTVDDLEIDHLTLVGDGNAGYGQTAIGNASGQTISNVRFHNNNISNINVGISLNANLGGSYTKAVVRDNRLLNIMGTVSGSGYGIQMAQATQVLVTGNTVDNASRHSIYCGRADVGNIIISDNLILNHRSTVSDSGYRCAVSVARSTNVSVLNNKLYNTYDGGIEISHETSGTVNCSNILVSGNTFTNRRTVNADIRIGEEIAQGATYKTSNIKITNNTFQEDVTLSGNGRNVIILNGTDIEVTGNKLNRTGVTATLSAFVEVGDSRYTSSVLHLNNVIVENNNVKSDASVGGSYLAYISTQCCTGTSSISVRYNNRENFASDLYFEATPTNPNSKYKFKFDYAYTAGAALGANLCRSIAAPTSNGIKPTSQFVVRPEYYVGPNEIMYSSFAQDNAYNTGRIFCANVSAAPIVVPTQSFICYVEDI